MRTGCRTVPGIRTVLRLLPVLLLAGCSLTVPLRGRIGSDVELSGDTTGYLDGSGALRITASDGRVCGGTFQYERDRPNGVGTFGCQDGTTAALAFSRFGQQGFGSGTTSRGERIRFAFGPYGATTFRE